MSGNGGTRRTPGRKRMSGNGGTRRAAVRERTSGNRAVVRWAWRLFRRDWRQQIMVLALLTVAVTTAVVGVSAGYHATPPAEARFGDAGRRIDWYGDGNPRQDMQIAQAREWFGTVDVMRHWYLPVPASAKTVEVRAQDPGGPYGGPMLRLLTGRFPATPGEVAVTDEAAANLRASTGGSGWTVVGRVENPGDLEDEFALVAPSAARSAQLGRPHAVTLLTAADSKRFAEYRARHPQPVYASRPAHKWVEAAAGVFSVFAVSLLLVCLIASAGFAVVAHRRLRQLGLFAAIGATPRHLRLVLLANGAAVGAAAAVLGVATGVLVWFAVTPRFETAAGHRIARLDLPWWQIAAALLLAVLAATVAAWRPARAVARVPITLALSARPPRPRRVHRSAAAAAVLVALGVAALRVAQRNTSSSNALGLADVVLVAGGTLAIGCALLFVGPLAIRVLAAAAARAPAAVRLAFRDLARFQARSSAALAAISVTLAVPAATVITAGVLGQTAAGGNLSDRQLLVWVDSPGSRVPERTPAGSREIEARLRQFTATLAGPSVIPLDVAVDPAEPPGADPEGGRAGRLPVGVGRDPGEGAESAPVVATPELLRHYGVDPGRVGATTDVLTTKPRPDLQLLPAYGRTTPATAESLPDPGFESLPTTFLTPGALRRHGWSPVRAGWLVESPRPLTGEQLSAARKLAVEAGLTVEDRDESDGLLTLRTTATAAGAVLALAILAMTVGLIRAETAGDLRTLTAIGATARIRRTLTSATAGGLALLGGILGIAAAYTVILAGSSRQQLHELARVPAAELLVIAGGVPLIAAVLGWLLAGREPRSLTRARLE